MIEQEYDLARELHSQLTKKQLLELCLVRLDRINELRRENLILRDGLNKEQNLLPPSIKREIKRNENHVRN